MKQFNGLFILLLLFLAISCERESVIPASPDDYSVNQDEPGDGTLSFRGGNKVDICHNGKIISVNINAVPAHQAHGDAVDMDGDGYFDKENDCGMPVDCDDNNYDPENSCACVEGEYEVTLPDGNTIYVFPVDNSPGVIWSPTAVLIGTDDWDGFANTQAIVNYYDALNVDRSTYAAGICAKLAEDTGCDWYLPAKEEILVVFEQLGPTGSGDLGDVARWSSTESELENIHKAWFQIFRDEGTTQFTDFKGAAINGCRCVRK